MNRTIKFRGKRIDNGEFVYGDLAHIHPEFYVGGREVEPESVAQLVGFDADGREVYEGDIIVDDIAEYVAHLFPNVRISDCKLKEATS